MAKDVLSHVGPMTRALTHDPVQGWLRLATVLSECGARRDAVAAARRATSCACGGAGVHIGGDAARSQKGGAKRPGDTDGDEGPTGGGGAGDGDAASCLAVRAQAASAAESALGLGHPVATEVGGGGDDAVGRWPVGWEGRGWGGALRDAMERAFGPAPFSVAGAPFTASAAALLWGSSPEQRPEQGTGQMQHPLPWGGFPALAGGAVGGGGAPYPLVLPAVLEGGEPQSPRLLVVELTFGGLSNRRLGAYRGYRSLFDRTL